MRKFNVLPPTADTDGDWEEVPWLAGQALLREDAGFHAYQMLEAGVRQFYEWGNCDQGHQTFRNPFRTLPLGAIVRAAGDPHHKPDVK
jgi:hypothetical protein